MEEKPLRDRTPFVVMTLSVLAAAGWWLYSRPSDKGSAGPKGDLGAEQEIRALLRQAREHPAPPPPPLPEPKQLKAPWVVRGKVLDIYGLAPLEGAELVFTREFMGAAGVSAVSDAAGRYRVELPGLPKGGYYVQVLHRDCDRLRFFTGKAPEWTAAGWEERVRLSRTDQPHAPFSGKPGAASELDIALVPREGALPPGEAAKIQAVK
jgi:hypothetical protein